MNIMYLTMIFSAVAGIGLILFAIYWQKHHGHQAEPLIQREKFALVVKYIDGTFSRFTYEEDRMFNNIPIKKFFLWYTCRQGSKMHTMRVHNGYCVMSRDRIAAVDIKEL